MIFLHHCRIICFVLNILTALKQLQRRNDVCQLEPATPAHYETVFWGAMGLGGKYLLVGLFNFFRALYDGNGYFWITGYVFVHIFMSKSLFEYAFLPFYQFNLQVFLHYVKCRSFLSALLGCN